MMKNLLAILVVLLVAQNGFGQENFLGEYKNKEGIELIINSDGSFIMYKVDLGDFSSILSSSKGVWEVKNDSIKLIPLIGKDMLPNTETIVINDTLSKDSLYFQVSSFDKNKPITDVGNLWGQHVELIRKGWNDDNVFLDSNGNGTIQKSNFKIIQVTNDDCYPVRIKYSALNGNFIKIKLVPFQNGSLLTEDIILIKRRNDNLKVVKGCYKKSLFRVTNKRDSKYFNVKDLNCGTHKH